MKLQRLDPVRLALVPALAAMMVSLSGCSAITGIFKAGVWVGIAAVVFVVAIIGGIAAFAGKA